MPTLKQVKLEAKKLYDVWRKSKTYSPALQAQVRISLMGWRHISGATGAKKRTYQDTYRRMKYSLMPRRLLKNQPPSKMLRQKEIVHFMLWKQW